MTKMLISKRQSLLSDGPLFTEKAMDNRMRGYVPVYRNKYHTVDPIDDFHNVRKMLTEGNTPMFSMPSSRNGSSFNSANNSRTGSTQSSFRRNRDFGPRYQPRRKKAAAPPPPIPTYIRYNCLPPELPDRESEFLHMTRDQIRRKRMAPLPPSPVFREKTWSMETLYSISSKDIPEQYPLEPPAEPPVDYDMDDVVDSGIASKENSSGQPTMIAPPPAFRDAIPRPSFPPPPPPPVPPAQVPQYPPPPSHVPPAQVLQPPPPPPPPLIVPSEPKLYQQLPAPPPLPSSSRFDTKYPLAEPPPHPPSQSSVQKTQMPSPPPPPIGIKQKPNTTSQNLQDCGLNPVLKTQITEATKKRAKQGPKVLPKPKYIHEKFTEELKNAFAARAARLNKGTLRMKFHQANVVCDSQPSSSPPGEDSVKDEDKKKTIHRCRSEPGPPQWTPEQDLPNDVFNEGPDDEITARSGDYYDLVHRRYKKNEVKTNSVSSRHSGFTKLKKSVKSAIGSIRKPRNRSSLNNSNGKEVQHLNKQFVDKSTDTPKPEVRKMTKIAPASEKGTRYSWNAAPSGWTTIGDGYTVFSPPKDFREDQTKVVLNDPYSIPTAAKGQNDKGKAAVSKPKLKVLRKGWKAYKDQQENWDINLLITNGNPLYSSDEDEVGTLRVSTTLSASEGSKKSPSDSGYEGGSPQPFSSSSSAIQRKGFTNLSLPQSPPLQQNGVLSSSTGSNITLPMQKLQLVTPVSQNTNTNTTHVNGSIQTLKDSRAGTTIVNVSGSRSGTSAMVNLSDHDFVQNTNTTSKMEQPFSNGYQSVAGIPPWLKGDDLVAL